MLDVGPDEEQKTGCCIWKGNMINDGTEFGPFWARQVCCKGEILSKYQTFQKIHFDPNEGINTLTCYYPFNSQNLSSQ